MMYATKIHMSSGYQNSNNCVDIDTIYLEGNDTDQFYKKANLYDHLKKYPNSIKVKRGTEPYLVPALSSRNEKYVRSEPNDTEYDNLLKLPRV
ncbi:DUF3892 domain-containing protein [Hydrogenoanaerobacterium sp.]|uniref:DUF3892 domain-containing protein n=1 Tax=Hydrogenoanaerobacterium sp. TaxID=2953763 RepID=UPI00289D8C6A|nr:DUF3892 domain-containing protein [Hydrogenoanaerobacterium sp.]